MAALEDFENTLKEVVGGKRLSASKMNRLTEIAMKSLEDDTKLVAILYRTHNSLPNSSKVSSLYAFDALARAARSLASKRAVTGDVNSEKSNAATFLLKIEGVLDGLFRDMVSLDNPEAKEKTKKVHDIWAKSNTFPSPVLTRLRDILSDVQKEIAVNPATSTDPRTTNEAIVTTPQSVPPIPDPSSGVQATLLALLGQAAQGHGLPSQTSPNTDPQLPPTQLALLQQLALAAKLTNGSTPPPGQTSPPIINPPPAAIPVSEAPHPPSRPPQTGRFDTPGDAPPARNGYQDRGRDFRDERRARGGARGGHRGRGRWDDHHNADRFRHRDRDWNPPRPRRSRSRSPRRQEERRNLRPRSPPHRPVDPREPKLPTPPTSAHDTDEFGREIRASHSPSRSASVDDTQTLAPMDSSVDPTAGVTPDNHVPVPDQSPLPLVAASTSAESTETHTSSPTTQQPLGLDQFDIATFDATAPSSWEGLGNMWQTTYGYMPSQEELMHFVMSQTMAASGMGNGELGGAQGGQWQQGNWQGHNGGWSGGRGGRGFGGGHGAEQSDAIVLNGDVEENDAMVEQGELHDSASGQGEMRRVGDDRVYVEPGAAQT